MKLVLNNVGIIKDSEINLNGLTVITGENNSGKTTVGKTMFSIVAAVENIEEMALQDKCAYSIAVMRKAVESMDLPRVYRQYTDTLDEEIPCNNNIECIIWNKNLKFSNPHELIKFIQTLSRDIELLTKNELQGKFSVNFDKEIISRRFDERWSNIAENKNNAISMLEQLIETIQADQQLIDYANIKIMKHLNGEFFNQIFPVKKLELETTSIILKKDTIKYYDISIKNKELKGDDESYFATDADNYSAVFGQSQNAKICGGICY